MEELHTLATASFCRIRNRTISFIIQKLAVPSVGPVNMFDSSERVKRIEWLLILQQNEKFTETCFLFMWKPFI